MEIGDIHFIFVYLDHRLLCGWQVY